MTYANGLKGSVFLSSTISPPLCFSQNLCCICGRFWVGKSFFSSALYWCKILNPSVLCLYCRNIDFFSSLPQKQHMSSRALELRLFPMPSSEKKGSLSAFLPIQLIFAWTLATGGFSAPLNWLRYIPSYKKKANEGDTVLCCSQIESSHLCMSVLQGWCSLKSPVSAFY